MSSSHAEDAFLVDDELYRQPRPEESMRTRVPLSILVALATGTSCRPSQTINTLPAPVPPTALVQYYDLELPADLEIKSVDFTATSFGDVNGTPGGPVGTNVSGRAFVKVYAAHRTTGEQYLLLYEDLGRRKQPVHIIRFVSGVMPAHPDSTIK